MSKPDKTKWVREAVGWVNIDPDNGDILIGIKGKGDEEQSELKFYCYHRTFKRLLEGAIGGCPIFEESD